MKFAGVAAACLLASSSAVHLRGPDADPDFEKLKATVTSSEVFQQKVEVSCKNAGEKSAECKSAAETNLMCALLQRSKPEMAADHCSPGTIPTAPASFVQVSKIQNRHSAPEDDLAK